MGGSSRDVSVQRLAEFVLPGHIIGTAKQASVPCETHVEKQ